jgi:hypothetical protein
MNPSILAQQNAKYRGSGGISSENRHLGFRPAFRNAETGHIYPSRFADGRLAPVHVIDGLPDDVVVARTAAGKVLSVKPSLQSGFLFDGCFYDRDEAAAYLAYRLADAREQGWL